MSFFFSANLRNESNTDIYVGKQSSEIVPAQDIKNVVWPRNCQVIFLEDKTIYLSTPYFPKGTYEDVSNKETRVNIMFDGDNFYYVSDSGEKYLIEKVAEC